MNVLSQVSVTFQDVAVDFTGEEWQLLGCAQRKALYKAVMLEISGNLVLVGEDSCSLENFLFLWLLKASQPGGRPTAPVRAAVPTRAFVCVKSAREVATLCA
uniref:KRAB domain-containing protein n=1 Tax=Sus scrofa TaxID=9823 RepID=A0A4X1W6B3_PIG